MSFTIRNSLEVEFTKAPAIAIAGSSGSGKTESAMRLARGWCDFFGQEERFAVIDTEEKRALYKQSRYQPWDWVDFQPPFTPERTWQALESVKKYRAVILDSASHEYAGPGGLQDIADETLERMAKGDPARMAALTGPSWKDAKLRHKREFMANLIRYPTLVIACLRAEPKVKFTKDEKTGKAVIVDAGYQPICEKMFMYEMLVSVMMYPDKAGVPDFVKALEVDLKPVFLEGERIDEGTGRRLAAWAAQRSAPGERGESARTAGATTAGGGASVSTPPSSSPGAEPERAAEELVTTDQVIALRDLFNEYAIPEAKFIAVGRLERLEQLPAARYDSAVEWVKQHKKPAA